jgi:2-dehydro-3-deoxygluconokinase
MSAPRGRAGGGGPGAWDLVTFGETMIRLTAAGGRRLEEAESLSVTVGGAESNVAVALARLGRRVAWLSALPRNPLGRRIDGELRRHGVDTARVLWSATDRVGVYFMDPGSVPRPTRVLYDRAQSAMARIDASKLDLAVVGRSRLLHLTGITPALSMTCATACRLLAEAAGRADVPVVLDVNYRARLWSPEDAVSGLDPLLGKATIVLCGQQDARTIWGLNGTAEEVGHGLLDRSRARIVVVTRGAEGALAIERDGAVHEQAAMEVRVVDPVGAGDAFAAGFLHAWLADDGDILAALRSGVALASIKMTIPGDFAIVTPSELDEAIALIDQRGADIDR